MTENQRNLVQQLAELAEENSLVTLVVSAQINDSGRLDPVQAIEDKLAAILKQNAHPSPTILAVADTQNIANDPTYVSHRDDGDGFPRLVFADTFPKLVEELISHRRRRKGVRPTDYSNTAFGSKYLSFTQHDDWRFEKVSEALGTPDSECDCPYRVVVCGPGEGKTAFVMEFIRRYQIEPFHDWILGGWYILRRAHPDWLKDEKLAGDIEDRLRRNLGCPLKKNEAEMPVDQNNAPAVLIAAIEAAAKRAEQRGMGILILVDGLDEAYGYDPSSRDRMDRLLRLFPSKELPGNVRILFASRPGIHLEKLLSAWPSSVKTIKFDDHTKVNADIRLFLEKKLAGPVVQQSSHEESLELSSLVGKMVEACEGNFLVAKYFGDQVAIPGQIKRWLSGEPLPAGLEDMLKEDWNHKVAALASSKTAEELTQVVLATLALWQQFGRIGNKSSIFDLLSNPTSKKSRKFGKAPKFVYSIPTKSFSETDRINKILDQFADWFEGDPDTYCFHHTRIPEVLLQKIIGTDIVKGLHRFLAWRCRQWESINNDGARRIALALAPLHGALGEDNDDLKHAAEMLADPIYLQATYDTLRTNAIAHLNNSYTAILERVIEAEQRKLLWNINRTLSQHDAILADGSLPVAAALYNDLGGVEDGRLRKLFLEQAQQRKSLVRRYPGRPSDIFTTKIFFEFLLKPCPPLFSPCGRWLIAFGVEQHLLFRISMTGAGINLAFEKRVRTSGLGRLRSTPGPDRSSVSIHDIPNIAFSPHFDDGFLWLAYAPNGNTVSLLSIGQDGVKQEFTKTFESAILALDFLPLYNGRTWLACQCLDNTIQLIPVSSQVVHLDGCHSIRINADLDVASRFAYSPVIGDRIWLACASMSHSIWLMPIGPDGYLQEHSKEMTSLITGHKDEILIIEFSSLVDDYVWLASYSPRSPNGDDQTHSLICLLSVGTNGPLGKPTSIESNLGFCFGLKFSPVIDNKILLAAVFRGGIGLLVLGPKNCYPENFNKIIPSTLVTSASTIKFTPVINNCVWLAYSSADGNIHVLPVDIAESIPVIFNSIEGHDYDFTISPSIDGNLMLASVVDGHHIAFSHGWTHREKLRRVDDYQDWVIDAAISPRIHEQVLLVSSSNAGTINLLTFDHDDGQSAINQSINECIAEGKNLSFSPQITDQVWLASTSRFGTIGLLPIGQAGSDKSKYLTIDAHCGSISGLEFSPAVGNHAWLAYFFLLDDEIGLLPIGSVTNEDKCQLKVGSANNIGETDIHDVAFSPAQGELTWFAISLDNGYSSEVGLLPIHSGRMVNPGEMYRVRKHRDAVLSIAFSPVFDGRIWLVSHSLDNTFGFLPIDADGPKLELYRSVPSPGLSPVEYAFSHPIEGLAFLAIGNVNCNIALLRIRRDGPMDNSPGILKGHRFEAFRLRFYQLPSKTLLLASASLYEVICWSIPDGTLLARAEFSRTAESVRDIAWSEDGRSLYIAGIKSGNAVDLTLTVPELG